MNNYLMQSDSDYIEQVQKAASTYNLMSILLIAIVIAVIVALICSFYIAGKEGSKPMRTIKNFDKYKKAVGKIVTIEEEIFSVQPYVKPVEGDSVLNTDEKANKTNAFLKEIEKYAAVKEAADPPKPIEKKRYKVIYTFAAEGSGDGFSGEFYAYEKNDAFKEGKEIEVQYDPERPQVNFTEYSRPI